ncbi:phosphatidic acid phosphatase [Xylophilus sp. Kf1]|nr:phosphatidic acid phosphatase [Xylophilus sp. Kf1]
MPRSTAPGGVAARIAARHTAISICACCALILWEISGLDLPLARLFGDVHGFALRGAYWPAVVLHQGARNAGWLLWAVIALAGCFPPGFLRGLGVRERVAMSAVPLLCLLVVTLMKHASATSCPWDLREFGGTLALVPHWLPGVVDGGGGHCFPAGHASTGFAFIAGFFVLAPRHGRLALGWLVASLLAGLLLGVSQQMRGAHFASHTLWTGWLCWTLGGIACRVSGLQASAAKAA